MTKPEAGSSKGWSIGLWIAQVLLAALFAMAGLMKLTTPISELAAQGMSFVEHSPAWLARFIGASEVAGALGLVLPAATRILPKLTPLAAAALALVMVLAAGYHASQGEWGSVPVNVVLGALAAFIAWGRLKKAPIAPR